MAFQNNFFRGQLSLIHLKSATQMPDGLSWEWDPSYYESDLNCTGTADSIAHIFTNDDRGMPKWQFEALMDEIPIIRNSLVVIEELEQLKAFQNESDVELYLPFFPDIQAESFEKNPSSRLAGIASVNPLPTASLPAFKRLKHKNVAPVPRKSSYLPLISFQMPQET